jgi:hypothetical protein
MKKPYCSDENRDNYEQNYTRQNGDADFPIYVGTYRQRGRALGNIIGSLFRRILNGLAPHVLRTGASIIEDVTQRRTLKESALQRIPETISKVVSGETSQSGSGIRRKRVRERPKLDIFS